MSLVSIFSVIINARYDMAIVLPADRKDAKDLLRLSLYITLMISGIIFIISLCFNEQISVLLGDRRIGPYLYLLPVSLIIAGVFQTFNQWNNRERQFRRLAVNRVFQSTSLAGSQFLIGVLILPFNGLILGETIGKAIAAFRLALLSNKDDRIDLLKCNFNNLKRLAKKYKEFPIYSTWSSLLNAISLQLPVFMFASHFSPTVVGYYTISNKFLNLPMNLLGNAVSQVYYQQAARYYEQDSNKLKQLTYKTFRGLLIVATIPMAVIAGFGDLIFGLIFGESWIIAGEYARLLSPSLLFVFCTSSITSLYFVLNKQKLYLIFDIALLLFRVVGLFIGVYLFESAVFAVAFYSLLTTISRIIMLLYTLNMVGIKILRVLLSIALYFILPFLGAIWIRNYYFI